MRFTANIISAIALILIFSIWTLIEFWPVTVAVALVLLAVTIL